MKTIQTMGALLMIGVLAGGCATTQINKPLCIIAGAAAGASIGGLASDDESPAMPIGALAGGLLAAFVCEGDTGPRVAAIADEDGDGVPDDSDQCPGTPRGTRVNSVGCPLDSDGDGVTDDRDRCPGTPPGVRVGADGCPLDSDGDGVTDNNDDCPDTPRGQRVNERGCHIIFTLEGVNFAYDSASLTADARTRLDGAVRMLNENPATKVRIAGHTDSNGSEEYNMGLSRRRAQAVVEYLVSKGISAARLDAVGYGETMPVADNTSAEGRARNRRVEFILND